MKVNKTGLGKYFDPVSKTSYNSAEEYKNIKRTLMKKDDD